MGRIFRSLLLLAVFTTFLANVMFILRTSFLSCGASDESTPWEYRHRVQNEQREHRNYSRLKLPLKHEKAVTTGEKPQSTGNSGTVTAAAAPKDRLVLKIEVYSSGKNVSVAVNGIKILDVSHVNYVGINVVIINQETGARMGSRAFDTYNLKEESDLLLKFVQDVSIGRIICFAVKDEGSNWLMKNARMYLKKLGSVFINRFTWRDTWAFVIQKTKHGARVLGEAFQKCGIDLGKKCAYGKDFGKWGAPVDLVTTFVTEKHQHCQWEDNASNRRRRKFCSQYEGYSSVCNCENPRDIDINPPAFADGTRLHLPVAVMVGYRPPYFFRMLTTLQNVFGLDVSMVTVYIDGFYNESVSVAELFGLKIVQHEPVSKLNGRIAQHYKKSLTTSFADNPAAQYLVILEEDLDISVDILSFFNQLLPVLEKDDSLFCISAWNDQGYEHAANDPSMLYRIETMPGLGWVLSRKIYKGELEKKWPGPEVLFDWDMWTRSEAQLKGRECIIPDISRTYHFGTKGLNVGSFMQAIYFKKHAFNEVPYVKLNSDIMYKDGYEKEMRRLIRSAELLDHAKTPCSDLKRFVPDTKSKTYVFFIVMKHKHDFQTWNNVARCFRIWDLDARGFHNSMFRLWYKHNHVIVVGCPSSVYCTLKPEKIVPIYMPKAEKRPKEDPY